MDKLDYSKEKEEEIEKEIKTSCDNMILTEQINNSDYFKPLSMNNESYGKTFMNKLILNLENFESIVDEETYKLFDKFVGSVNETVNFRGFIFYKMIILLFEELNKIKFFFYGKEKKEILKFSKKYAPK